MLLGLSLVACKRHSTASRLVAPAPLKNENVASGLLSRELVQTQSLTTIIVRSSASRTVADRCPGKKRMRPD